MDGETAAEAHEDGLVLRLVLAPTGGGILAEASLTNEGSRSWEYSAGGGLPPPVQIEARDAAGQVVYRWTAGFVTAHWRARRTLAPGETVSQRVELTGHGPLFVRAFVTGQRGVEAGPIEVPKR